jgi:putative transport protein
VVGAALATWASTIRRQAAARQLRQVADVLPVHVRRRPARRPAFFNALKKDGITFTILAVICSVLGLFLVVFMCKLLDLPPGAAGGVLAGSQTMSAAIGTADMAVARARTRSRTASPPKQISGMIALGYGVTYIWGTVGIILICKYLPRWWGVDAKKAAREYEAAHGVQNVDDAG